MRVKDNVYTPEKVSNVLFNVSRPTGYKTDEVEKFVDDTEYSIAYYIEYIEDKNGDIHQLANEINQLRTNIKTTAHKSHSTEPEGLPLLTKTENTSKKRSLRPKLKTRTRQ